METEHGNKFKREVCIYECAGTALLVYAVNVSKADPVAICFSLFTAIMIAGPISGGHFNPAVSIGVFISQNKPVDKLVLLGCILASQFAGGLIGALFAFLSLTNVTETVNQVKGSIPEVEQVILRPKVSVGNAFNIEVICTFMFVFVILIVKTARLAPTKSGLLAVLGVVWNLMALTRTAGASGACLNPSVGFAQTILQYTQAEIPDEHFQTVMYMYVFGPLVGGCIAGITHRGHIMCFSRIQGRETAKPSATEPLMDDYKEAESQRKA